MMTDIKPYKRAIEDIEVQPEEDFRRIEYDFLKCVTNIDAWIEPNEKYYDLLLKLDLPDIFKNGGYELSCNPLGLKSNLQALKSNQTLRFKSIPLHKLSCFIHWQILTANKRNVVDLVTKIEIRDMPECRLSNILKSIIDRPEKFMALLTALLSNEPQSISSPGKKGHGKANGVSQFGAPIYEELILLIDEHLVMSTTLKH